MSAHPAPRATRAIRAETPGSSGLALGPNQRGKGGGEVEASIPFMAVAHQRTRGRVRPREHGTILPRRPAPPALSALLSRGASAEWEHGSPNFSYKRLRWQFMNDTLLVGTRSQSSLPGPACSVAIRSDLRVSEELGDEPTSVLATRQSG